MNKILNPKLLISVSAITLMAVWYLVFSYVNSSVDQRYRDHKEALRIAEYGMQNMLQMLYMDPQSVLKGAEDTYGSGGYKVTVQPGDSGSYQIASVAQVEGLSRRILCHVARETREGKPAFRLMSWKEE